MSDRCFRQQIRISRLVSSHFVQPQIRFLHGLQYPAGRPPPFLFPLTPTPTLILTFKPSSLFRDLSRWSTTVLLTISFLKESRSVTPKSDRPRTSASIPISYRRQINTFHKLSLRRAYIPTQDDELLLLAPCLLRTTPPTTLPSTTPTTTPASRR